MEAISSFHSLYSRFGKVDYYPFIHKDDFRSLIYNLLLQEFGPLKKYLLKNRPHSWMLCFPQKGTMRDNSRFFFFLESAGPLILQNGTQTIDAFSIQEIMKVASLILGAAFIVGRVTP